MLEIDAVDVAYGDLQVLWQVSLNVQEGEIVALLGPNGAGKTTLMRAVAGLCRTAGGAIRFEGQELTGVPGHRIVELGIVMVPEGRRVFGQMTVDENLRMGAFPQRARAREAQSRQWLYELFPILRQRLGQTVGTMSGGEQQMVAIARALMSRPRLLLLDEPSQGLAPKIVRHIFEVIAEVSRGGITVLLVEQNVHVSLATAGRAYVLEAGRIVQAGPAAELRADEHVRKAYLGLV